MIEKRIKIKMNLIKSCLDVLRTKAIFINGLPKTTKFHTSSCRQNTKYYPINDDFYNLNDDQKQVGI